MLVGCQDRRAQRKGEDRLDQEARHADVDHGQDADDGHPAWFGSSPTSSLASRSAAATTDSSLSSIAPAGQADLPGVTMVAGGPLDQGQVGLPIGVGVDQDQDRCRAARTVGEGRHCARPVEWTTHHDRQQVHGGAGRLSGTSRSRARTSSKRTVPDQPAAGRRGPGRAAAVACSTPRPSSVTRYPPIVADRAGAGPPSATPAPTPNQNPLRLAPPRKADRGHSQARTPPRARDPGHPCPRCAPRSRARRNRRGR